MDQTVFCGRDDELASLKDAWRVVTEENRPQLVTLLGESGLGKTRLVQEFYRWLAQTHRSEHGRGYWPLHLRQSDQNLVVNPDIAGVDSEQVMPFLWWAVRLIDPSGRNQVISSSVSTFVKALTPHLQAMYRARRVKGYWQESGKTVGGTALSTALGFIPFVGPIISHAPDIFELIQVSQEARKDKHLQPQDADQQASNSLNERIVADLSQLFRNNDKEASIPMILVIDDAHFSVADPDIVDLFTTLARTAQYNDWPLLTVVTHWEKEWHQQIGDDTTPSIANSIQENYWNLNPSWQPLKLEPIPNDELTPVLRDGLPGLTAEQAGQLLARADGNPRFLDEIIKLCLGRPRYFVDRNARNPLSDRGLEDVLATVTSLHALVESRLNDAPAEVRNIITLSSMQGIRLLYLISQRLIEHLIAKGHDLEGSQHPSTLQLAQAPHAFINILGNHLSEFSQRVYYEVAREGIGDILDPDEAFAGLTQVLKDLIHDDHDDFTDDEQGLRLELTAEVLAQSDQAEDRRQALGSYAALSRLALDRFDFRTALRAADGALAGASRESWRLTDLSFDELWNLHDAFVVMGRLDDAHTTALAMKAAAERSGNHRNLSISYALVGDIQHAKGELDAALTNYTSTLAILEELAEILGTSESKHDLSVSYNRVGDVQFAEGDLDAALTNYTSSLSIALELAETVGTPESNRDLSVSYERVGNIQLARGDLDAALTNYTSSLGIREELAETMGAPESKRDQGLSYARMGDVQHAKGELDAALTNYTSSLGIALELAELLGTPESKRDLSVSYNLVGDVQFAEGDLDAALTNYTSSLSIALELAETVGTPESKRDLSVSYERVGDVQLARGDLDAALTNYTSSLGIREELAEIVGTPESKRDLSVSYNKLGDVQRAKEELDTALTNYTSSLGIREELAETMGTPESKRDLSISYQRLALAHQAQGKHGDLREVLTLGLAAARHYQTFMPYQDAASLVAWFQARLNELGP